MGYGKKGWFKTYIQMMKNSFKYDHGKRGKWHSRGLSLLFAIIWRIFVVVLFVIIPLFVIAAVPLIVLKCMGII